MSFKGNMQRILAVADLTRQGKSGPEIAAELGITLTLVYNLRNQGRNKGLDVPYPADGRVERVIAMIRAGESAGGVARLEGITPNGVYAILQKAEERGETLPEWRARRVAADDAAPDLPPDPPRVKVSARAGACVPPTGAAPLRLVPATVHPVLATEGRYMALAVYAAAQGITLCEALRQWHQHRRAAVKAVA